MNYRYDIRRRRGTLCPSLPLSLFSGFDPTDRPIPIPEFYASRRVTCKKGTPSSLDYHDVTTATSSVTRTKTTAVFCTPVSIAKPYVSHELSASSSDDMFEPPARVRGKIAFLQSR